MAPDWLEQIERVECLPEHAVRLTVMWAVRCEACGWWTRCGLPGITDFVGTEVHVVRAARRAEQARCARCDKETM